jgi:hypothetical protein
MPVEDYLKELEQIAPAMESLRAKWWPRIHYHLLADALYWSDEFPPLSTLAENAMRPVLRHRTLLILGETPEPKWEPFWTEAQAQFPRWIGFRRDRVNGNHALREALRAFRADANPDRLF